MPDLWRQESPLYWHKSYEIKLRFENMSVIWKALVNKVFEEKLHNCHTLIVPMTYMYACGRLRAIKY